MFSAGVALFGLASAGSLRWPTAPGITQKLVAK
jgi:hypothetical protein